MTTFGLNLPGSTGYTPEARAWAQKNVDAIALWTINWAKAEPVQGQLDLSHFTQLDEQIAQVRADGKQLYICHASDIPAWAYAGRAAATGQRNGLPPDENGIDSPWAQLMFLSMERYPDAIHIIQNECNSTFRNQPDMHLVVADQVQTAIQLARSAGVKQILICAAAQGGEPIGHPVNATTFIHNVAGELMRRWGRTGPWQRRGVKVGVSTHFYHDTRTASTAGLHSQLRALRDVNWHDRPVRNLKYGFKRMGPRIWDTEDGQIYRTHHIPGWDYYADPAYWRYDDMQADEQAQLVNVLGHLAACRDLDPTLGTVMTSLNYEFRSSLWSGWASGPVAFDGHPHPILAALTRNGAA